VRGPPGTGPRQAQAVSSARLWHRREVRVLPVLPLEFTLARGPQLASGTGQLAVDCGVLVPPACVCAVTSEPSAASHSRDDITRAVTTTETFWPASGRAPAPSVLSLLDGCNDGNYAAAPPARDAQLPQAAPGSRRSRAARSLV